MNLLVFREEEKKRSRRIAPTSVLVLASSPTTRTDDGCNAAVAMTTDAPSVDGGVGVGGGGAGGGMGRVGAMSHRHPGTLVSTLGPRAMSLRDIAISPLAMYAFYFLSLFYSFVL